MRIKIYKHNSVRTTIDDDILKIPLYFNSDFVRQYINEPIIYDVENTNKNYQDDILFKPNENTYDVVMFIFEQGTFPIYGQAELYSNKLVKIYVSVNPIEDNIDYSWKVMCHELVHAIWFGIMIRDSIYIPNVLDNSLPTPYFLNENPYAPDGNFAQQLKLLKPYYVTPVTSQLYKPKNFTLKELVPKAVIDKLGDKAWQLLDERMLRNWQFLRDNLGQIMLNSPTQQYRCFDNVFRKEGLSQHNHGRAGDGTFKNYTAEQVREWLRVPANASRLPEPNIWVELGTPWLHMDVRYSDKKGVYFFQT